MKQYCVLYHPSGHDGFNPPEVFMCQGDDTDHVEEQTENAYPGCEVIWVHLGDDVQEAYAEYWDSY